MASGSREKCLEDNCCFDETAEPARQCFFKPSAPGKQILSFIVRWGPKKKNIYLNHLPPNSRVIHIMK